MSSLDIHFLAQNFYALEAISALLLAECGNNFAPMRHSHDKWYQDFNDFRNEYISRFSSALFDYTALVVAGELRHGWDKASHHIRGYCSCGISRDDVYHNAKMYNPQDILLAGIRMFDPCKVGWRALYGGIKWYQIAKAGLMKNKVDDCVFIDHCVDLSHNNSIYFDKGAGIFYLRHKLEYKDFLDFKHVCAPWEFLTRKHVFPFNRLLLRANNLNILDVKVKENLGYPQEFLDEMELQLFGYQPIHWGNKRLNYAESNIGEDVFFSNNTRQHKDKRGDRDDEFPQAA